MQIRATLNVEKPRANCLHHRSPNLRITLLSPMASQKAIVEAQRWRVAYPEMRQGLWDWGKVVSSFRRRLRHIELAIWVNHALCGLLIGRISDNRIVATIYISKVVRLVKTLSANTYSDSGG
jgi:hypothetical protein